MYLSMNDPEYHCNHRQRLWKFPSPTCHVFCLCLSFYLVILFPCVSSGFPLCRVLCCIYMALLHSYDAAETRDSRRYDRNANEAEMLLVCIVSQLRGLFICSSTKWPSWGAWKPHIHSWNYSFICLFIYLFMGATMGITQGKASGHATELKKLLPVLFRQNWVGFFCYE